VEEEPVTLLDMLMKKGLSLININPKQCRGQGATLFNPNGGLDEIKHPVNCAEMTQNRLI
jgi:hypothetical protein